MFEQSQRLQEKLYILAQIIQTVSDANDMKTAAPMLTKSQFQLLNIISMSGGRTVSELADLLGRRRDWRPGSLRPISSLCRVNWHTTFYCSVLEMQTIVR